MSEKSIVENIGQRSSDAWSRSRLNNEKVIRSARVAASLLAMAALAGVGYQTSNEAHGEVPPAVTANPLSWPATPLAQIIRAVEGTSSRPAAPGPRDFATLQQQEQFLQELQIYSSQLEAGDYSQ